MKYKNVKKKYLDLQLFAEDAPGNEGGEETDKDPEDGTDRDDDLAEKKFSQKDVDDAVEKRLARERRKWKRQQKADSKDRAEGAEEDGADPGNEKAQKAAEDRASSLEVKVACYEAGVARDAVEDVAALAKSYMAAEEGLDLEDAVEKVVKKYPQFKDGAGDGSGDSGRRKGWGERHNTPARSEKTVDDELRRQLFGK